MTTHSGHKLQGYVGAVVANAKTKEGGTLLGQGCSVSLEPYAIPEDLHTLGDPQQQQQQQRQQFLLGMCRGVEWII